MYPILQHELIVLRRNVWHHLGDVKSFLTVIVGLSFAIFAFYANLSILRDRLGHLPALVTFSLFAAVPLIVAYLAERRAAGLARQSLVSVPLLDIRNRIAFAGLFFTGALAVNAAAWALMIRGQGTSADLPRLPLAILLWIGLALVVAIAAALGAALFGRIARGGRFAAAVAPAYPATATPGAHAVLAAICSQQTFHSAYGRIAIGAWLVPTIILLCIAALRGMGLVIGEVVAGALVFVLFFGTLLLARTDYRTVRLMKIAGIGRWTTLKAQLVAPAAFALGTGFALALAIDQWQVGVGVAGLGLVIAILSIGVRTLSYRAMGRGQAELYIQKWLWLCGLSGIFFVPAALVILVAWIVSLINLESDLPIE